MGTTDSDGGLTESRRFGWVQRLLAYFLLVVIIAVAAGAIWFRNQSQSTPPVVEAATLPKTEKLAEISPPAGQIPTSDEPILIPRPPEFDPGAIRDLLPRDSIQAIDDPQFVSTADANAFMAPDERVIGLIINGDARAYPIPILSNHEIVNDIVGGRPVAVTWCPLCFTALVFSRDVEFRDEPLSFGVSGSLLFDTLVMYDRQTSSLWSQLYGVAVDGPLVDSRLSFYPSVLTEWRTWLEQNPGSQVLSKPLTCAQFDCGTYATNPRGSYDIDPYESYYIESDEGVFERQIPREEGAGRGYPKERVLGIRLAGLERAYPYQILREELVINDLVNGQPILVWFDPQTETGIAYLRQVDGRSLTLEPDPGDPKILLDLETGSQWQAATGTAIAGSLEGKRLSSLVATTAFAFGWYDYFPASETYGS